MAPEVAPTAAAALALDKVVDELVEFEEFELVEPVVVLETLRATCLCHSSLQLSETEE